MEVAELDASTFLTREPYHLSLSLADDLLKIIQKQKGFQNIAGPSKQVLFCKPRMP